MNKFIKDILTGIDNETYDHGRVMSLASFISYVGYGIASMIQGHPWAAMDFSAGLSALAVGFGIHLKLKENTEPQ